MPSTKTRAANERRARVEAMRREEARRQRRQTLLISGISGVVVLVIVVVIVLASVHKHTAATAEVLPAGVDTSQKATVEPKATTVKAPVNLPGLVAYDTSGHLGNTDDGHGLPFTHVTGPVTYSVTPPVGGDHNPVWMNAGIYDAPVPTERAVHDLEHGAVWITYEPSLPKSEVSTLTALFKRQKPMVILPGQTTQTERFMDLTPWKDDSIGAPIVISAWGFQLKVQSASDPRLQTFIDDFRHVQKYTPEWGASVEDSPVNQGGRPQST